MYRKPDIIEHVYDEEFSCVLAYVFILLDISGKCELIKDISGLFGIDGSSIVSWTETNDSISVKWFDRYNKKIMIDDFEKKNHMIYIK